MAEVNASITQLFKDKLKSGQIAQTPVYPKTVGEAVDVIKYKGADKSNTEKLNTTLYNKVGYQCYFLCPNGWWYLYSFDHQNNFVNWRAIVGAMLPNYTGDIINITSLETWGTLTQDDLDEAEAPFTNKGLLFKWPIRPYSTGSSNPEDPDPDEPDPPTPPPTPTVHSLKVDEFNTYTNPEYVLDDVRFNMENFTLIGTNIEGRIRITVSAAYSSDNVNFVPNLGTVTPIDNGGELTYPNVLEIDVNSVLNNVCSSTGLNISLFMINELDDSTNIVTIECVDDDAVDNMYFAIQHPVSESTIIAPDEIANLPKNYNLTNKAPNNSVNFLFQTQNASDDITISVLPAQVSGENVNFYAYFKSRKQNKNITVENPCNPTITVDASEANAGIEITINSGPSDSGPYGTINTTNNNYGKVTIDGVGNSVCTIANLYYAFVPDETTDTKVTLSNSVIYLNMVHEPTTISNYYGNASYEYEYSFASENTDVKFVNFSSAPYSIQAVNTNIPAIYFKVDITNFSNAYNRDTFFLVRFFKKVSDGNGGYKFDIPKFTSGSSTYPLFGMGFLRSCFIDGNNVLNSTWNYTKSIYTAFIKVPSNTTFSKATLEFYFPLYSPSISDDSNRALRNTELFPILTGEELYLGVEHSTSSTVSPSPQDISGGFMSVLNNNTIYVPIYTTAKPEQDSNDSNLVDHLSTLANAYSKDYLNEDMVLSTTVIPDNFMYGILRNEVGTFNELDLSDFTNLRSIGKYAFGNCTNLETAILPNSITNIDIGAFKGCENLELINIPTNMKAIKPETFYKTSVVTDPVLQAIVLPNKITTVGSRAFAENTSVGRVTIPASITSIGDECFINCTNLATVTFNGESNLKTLGRSVFANCSSLLSIAIPNGVTVLEAGTFSGCSSLTTVDLGTGIGVLPGTGLFNGCVAMTDLYLRFTTEVEGSSVGVVWPMPIGGTRFTFEDEVKENSNFTIHVPSEVLSWYRENEFWLAQVDNDSDRIVAIDE